MGRTWLTRRRALAAAGAGLLAGCSGGPGEKAPAPPLTAAERARRAETASRRRSAAVSRDLLTAYDEVMSAHPALGSRLSPLREATARHVTALAPPGEAAATAPPSRGPVPTATAPDPGGPPARTSASGTAARADRADASVTPSAAPDRGSSSRPLPRGVPAEPGAALKELAGAVARTAAAHTAALADAPPELARLLASVAAAGAAQAYLLGEGSRS
ncbi:hypothetical protein [Streptomyces sp. TRM49041]|uniref:hypothetical protein n=1 Tax=Streptomyces sp. TRM49041 TaxID=2603216 RepID=UPI0011EC9CAD|nr:hypothetical protein [Streptomyces sp. TRM49041]